MFNKKAQGMPINVIIIAISVLVVLVIIIAFFAGGFSGIGNKIRDLFAGKTQGQAKDIAIQTCEEACDVAESLSGEAIKRSSYCTSSFIVDLDANVDTAPEKVACGDKAVTSQRLSLTKLSESEKRRGIEANGNNLGVDCDIPSC